jgi:hypothetical protein
MYLNKTGFSLPHGLAMGGRLNKWRFYLDEEFDKCETGTGGFTYRNGTYPVASPFLVAPQHSMYDKLMQRT